MSQEAGAPLDQYVLENDNGARAIVRTYGGNSISYITKVQLMFKAVLILDIIPHVSHV